MKELRKLGFGMLCCRAQAGDVADVVTHAQ